MFTALKVYETCNKNIIKTAVICIYRCTDVPNMQKYSK